MATNRARDGSVQQYIEQATQSVLAQRYLNLDYFNVDGGSTDGTVEIIRKDELQISRHSG